MMKMTEDGQKIISIPYLFNTRSYQSEVFDAFTRGIKRIVLVWHRKSGKDVTMLNLTIKAMMPGWDSVKNCIDLKSNPGARIGNYYHIFPTYSQGKKILWDGIDSESGMKILDHFPKELMANKNEKDMKITLWHPSGRGTGSTWQILGADRGIDNLVGPGPVGVVFSEYSIMSDLVWDLYRPILRQNGGWAAFIYTPRGKNHGKKLIDDNRNKKDWFILIKTVRDTKKDAIQEGGSPVISEEAIQRDRDEGMDEDLIQQEYYCSFEGYQQGSIFSEEMKRARDAGRMRLNVWTPELPVDTAWDLGISKSDTTAIWFFQQFGNEIRWVDYYECSQEGLPHYANVLFRRNYTYRNHYAPHDIKVHEFTTGQSRYEVARSLGITFTILPKQDPEDRIHASRMILSTSIFDETKCKQGINALDSFHRRYDVKGKCYGSSVHDWSSHAAEAFGNGALSIRKNRTSQSVKAIVKKDWDVFNYKRAPTYAD